MILTDSRPQPIHPLHWRSPAQVKASDFTPLSATTTTCCRSPGTTSQFSSLVPTRRTFTIKSKAKNMLFALTIPSPHPQGLCHRFLWPYQEWRGGRSAVAADHRAHRERHGQVRHRVQRREGRREEDGGAGWTGWGPLCIWIPTTTNYNEKNIANAFRMISK